MEGKETRFGIAASALFAAVTTATSCGAVNTMHDSMTPLGGFVPLFLIQLGELAPGGVGTGIYSILMFAILGVFIAGLMIGRTPEYLGKKIEALEMKLASVFILTTPFVVLIGTAVAVSDGRRQGRASRIPGAHGFSEILYAFSSAANNNGSAFAGISANTVFYNVATGLAMFIGRFWPIVAALAHRRLAGGEEARSGDRGHDADARAAVRGAAHRLDPADRRPDLRPGARAGTGGRAFHARRSQLERSACRGNNCRCSIASSSARHCSSR